ncbi:related to MET1 - siroheme synthase [Melanopsichium pennsylvanicum]|uniref:precorrin-2 dehydrogenase n=2 Tax=Melanopsichium pennsylvanicum TaxID=63383 RepID=A0AAJ4XMS2_9BASI|nr:related to MET1-siroheme synthase [Melanopsichium pennsylvanicum 4]SNX85734.1 related to MET1 - siroheme synthase [Melanopsichium pennsylvanicum]
MSISQVSATPCTSLHFPEPNPTASLLLSHRPAAGKVALVLGTGKLAASRCFACLEAAIKPIVISVSPSDSSKPNQACPEIQHRIASGQVLHHTVDSIAFSTKSSVQTTFDHILNTFDGDYNAIFAVCITDTLHSGDDPHSSSSVAHAAAKNGDDELSDTLAPLTSYARAEIITHLCRKRRIPINVADKPNLCDFSFPANYRFPCTNPLTPTAAIASASATSAHSSSLQIAVTTNGRGCRLAGRIRREIVSALPHNVGDAVEKVGVMRDLAKRQSEAIHEPLTRISAGSKSSASVLKRLKRSRIGKDGTAEVEEEDLSFDTTPLNSPVPQLVPKNPLESAATNERLKQLQAEEQLKHDQVLQEAEDRTKRRMRWVAQISEYWPIEYLGDLKEAGMMDALRAHGEEQSQVSTTFALQSDDKNGDDSSSRGRSTAPRNAQEPSTATPSAVPSTVAHRARSQHSLDIRPPPSTDTGRGHIYLLGSGPGHPGLLTTFAYKLLTSSSTDLILSDKLVPASILKLIPSTTPLEIAKKFPGNAEGAQSELIAKALRAALEQGKTVVRLKQGDPFVYGRGGEEVLAFRNAGIECTVVPGISSSIAAPAMLGIPVTQRGAADSLVLCTGVGKGGKKVKLPGYDRGRTLIVLMGVARLKAVVATLTNGAKQSGVENEIGEESIGDREGPVFPPYMPIAIIERASSSDQRMVASTLDGIVEALENSGEQRPPGMMVIGWSVLSLEGKGDVSIQDDALSIETKNELEKRDKERVQSWLKGRGWIVREGLDHSYRSALNAFHSTPLQLPDLGAGAPPTHHAQEAGAKETLKETTGGKDGGRFSQRDESGWAPPRYSTGKPEGGWMSGEAPNRPATDQLAYEQDKTYADIQARLRHDS